MTEWEKPSYGPEATASARVWDITPYRPELFPRLRRLASEISRAAGGKPVTEDHLRRRLADRHWVPARDIWVAAPGRDGTELVGWVGYLAFDEEETGQPRVFAFLTGGVHPAWRGRGLGSELLNLAWRELAARYESRLGAVNVSVNENFPEYGRFFANRGFTRTRAVYEMRWVPASGEDGVAAPSGCGTAPDGDGAAPGRTAGADVPSPPAGLDARPLATDGDFAASVDVFNAAFAEHPNFVRTTVEDIREAGSRPGWLPEANLGLWAGPEMVGVVFAHLDSGGRGYIESVGVAPEHRGKGLGLFLVRRAASALAGAGATHVELTVVGENETAIRIYRKAGFAASGSYATYTRSAAP